MGRSAHPSALRLIVQRIQEGERIAARLAGNWPAVASFAFLVLITFAAVIAPFVSPYGPGGLQESRLLEPPSWDHWMGTDMLGRDLLTRVLLGARVSLTVGVGTALIALVLGTVYGLVAGYRGGTLDSFLMRVVDIFYGLPELLIFILLSLVLGRNVGGMLVALGLLTWVRFARIARGQMLQAKQLLYVDGARAMGAGHFRIVARHILPNMLGPILVTLTFSIPAAILTESTLSFIGLGINDPYSAWGTSWGTLAQDGWRAMRSHPHVILFPGSAIFTTILAFNFLGNGLRDWLDPRTVK
jgi:oligopeptide transport system permease protein